MASDTILTEYVSCDLCGSSDQALLYSKIDPVTRKEFHLVECSCGMAFVNPMPTAESIPLLYPADYLRDKTDLTALYDRMMKYLPVERGKLLDIGCGRGDFINYASKAGWDVEGVDLMDWGTPHTVPIRVGDFLTMDFQGRYYDVVTAWALLEHVRAPSAFFGRVSRLLKDNGLFVFVVPNFGAPGMKHCCTEDVPRHLWLFTPRAVESYLARYGLEARAVYHNDALYTAYPFGLVRYGLRRLWRRATDCSSYQNKSVALLRNRQIKGNATAWLGEVLRSVGPSDVALDLIDLGLGVLLAHASKLIGNYGVTTVVAGRIGQKKSNPKLEDC
jgi:SAM-dependent methyltransferase